MKLLFVVTKAGALLLIAKSATDVTVVTTGGLMSSLVLTSGTLAVAAATFVMMPLTGAVTVKVRLVVALTARLPKFQFTTPELFVVPFPLALTKITPGGSASLATELLAVAIAGIGECYRVAVICRRINIRRTGFGL